MLGVAGIFMVGFVGFVGFFTVKGLIDAKNAKLFNRFSEKVREIAENDSAITVFTKHSNSNPLRREILNNTKIGKLFKNDPVLGKFNNTDFYYDNRFEYDKLYESCIREIENKSNVVFLSEEKLKQLTDEDVFVVHNSDNEIELANMSDKLKSIEGDFSEYLASVENGKSVDEELKNVYDEKVESFQNRIADLEKLSFERAGELSAFNSNNEINERDEKTLNTFNKIMNY